MQLKPKQLLLCFLLLFCSCGVVAQSSTEATAKLFRRYETGAALNRLGEDVLTLTLEQKNKDITIGVRVCSKERMPFALVTANADPFYIVERLVEAHGYLPKRVFYLRSEDCMSSDPAELVTEIWIIPNGASLPAHLEAARASDVKLTALGKQEANRGVRDYRTALQKLIRDLRANPSATGIVFGYFLDRPSQLLQQRLREVTRTLERSGLPRQRYLVRPIAWNDEVASSDKEPNYPALFIVEIVEITNARTGRVKPA